MSPAEAKKLVGRRIVAVDMNGGWEIDPYGGCRAYMHDPKITLDDGSVLRFVVEEHPAGAEYGVDIVRGRVAKKRGAATGDPRWRRCPTRSV